MSESSSEYILECVCLCFTYALVRAYLTPLRSYRHRSPPHMSPHQHHPIPKALLTESPRRLVVVAHTQTPAHSHSLHGRRAGQQGRARPRTRRARGGACWRRCVSLFGGRMIRYTTVQLRVGVGGPSKLANTVRRATVSNGGLWDGASSWNDRRRPLRRHRR